jgi:hypothetical protein
MVVLEGMANHEDNTVRRGRENQGARIRARERQGLFYQHMLAHLDGGQRDRHMRARWSGYHHGIDMRERQAQGRIAAVGSVSPGQLPETVFSIVNEYDFRDVFCRMQNPGMLGPPIATSDQGNADSVRLRESTHEFLPVRCRPKRLRK